MKEDNFDEEKMLEYVAAAQQGNAEAFGAVYDSLADKVYRFILFRTRHRETAQDLTHVTFLKAWEGIRSYERKQNTKFSTWLFQIAYYTVIDHYRRQKPEVELNSILNAVSVPGGQHEAMQDLVENFERLPADYRSVLQLRFIEGFSVEETAVILKRSPVATRVLQHRALRRLAKLLQ